MATSEYAKLLIEGGQDFTAMSALTDSGDATTFEGGATYWSKKTGFAYEVHPDGVATGGDVIPAVSGTNDLVDGRALTCYLAGVLTAVAADTDLTCTRGATTGYTINSITINSGGAYAVVAGTEGTASFSETRAAAGGPPLIPVGSIEVAQVRLAAPSGSAAPVTSAEIYAVPGTHREETNYPIYTVSALNGSITFASALPLSHTAAVPKGVFASYADPIFAEVPLTADFVAPENSYSVTSTQVYNATIGSTSSTLGQGSFTGYLSDGVTDTLVGLEGETLWFKFYPDRNKTPFVLCQGKLGIARTFPADGQNQAACTISAESAATNLAS